MLKTILLLFICLISFHCKSQTAIFSIQMDSTNRISVYDDSVWMPWRQIDSAWLASEYRIILAKFKLKMNCANCESVRMDVDMMVDSLGKLSGYRKIESNKCGNEFDKKLEDAFMAYFYNITFPAVFRKHIFAVTLGTVLKC